MLVVLPHDGDGDAVRVANNSIFGLSGGVISADRDRALKVARGIRTGTMSVNGGLYYGPDAPFGGYKQSGMGREMGGPSCSSTNSSNAKPSPNRSRGSGRRHGDGAVRSRGGHCRGSACRLPADLAIDSHGPVDEQRIRRSIGEGGAADCRGAVTRSRRAPSR